MKLQLYNLIRGNNQVEAKIAKGVRQGYNLSFT
jgi:hypothetical protein